MSVESRRVMLTGVRLAFPALFRAETFGDDSDGKPSYKATAIIPKSNTKLLRAVKDAMRAAFDDKWGAKKYEDEKFRKRVGFRALRDGGEKEEWDGFDDSSMFITASNPKRPRVVDRDTSPLVEEDERVYGGCYVNMHVEFWAQDNKYGKYVNASLMGVQFVKDGESFGGSSVSSEDSFDSLDEEDADDGLSETSDDPLA